MCLGRVTAHSIRERILKVVIAVQGSSLAVQVTAHSIRERILKEHKRRRPVRDEQVTAHSIRERILKVGQDEARVRRVGVTAHSIRERILKDFTPSYLYFLVAQLQPTRSERGY